MNMNSNSLKFQDRLNLACQASRTDFKFSSPTSQYHQGPPLRIDLTNNLLKGSFSAISNYMKMMVQNRINISKNTNTAIYFVNVLKKESNVSVMEWLMLLIELFFKENPEGKADDFTAPLFEMISEESGLYAPNMKYSSEVFKFAGIILAAAFNSGVGIRVELIESIYRCLWEIEPYDLSHLEAHDPVIAKQFRDLMTADKVTISKSNLDLKRGQTVKDYIEKQTADILYLRYKSAIDAIVKGFYLNCNPNMKQHLSMYEFEIALTGNARYSTEDLFKSCTFSPHNASLIAKFRQILEEFTEEQKMKFIKFATNVAAVNPFALIPQINVYFDYVSHTSLPTAGTCARRINLPIISTVSEWKRKIIFAIEETDTFSYIYG